MFGKKKKNPGYSYFSSDVTLEGRLCFTGSVRIDGRVNGEIISTGLLVVEEMAIITGDILVENIILSGTVYGNIQASKQVQLHATAKVYGHINYGELSIEGALHEGSSHKLSPDEIAIVQRECAELMEEAAARAEKFVPDMNEADRYTLKPGSNQKRVNGPAAKVVQALPDNEKSRSPEQPRAAEQPKAPEQSRPVKTQAQNKVSGRVQEVQQPPKAAESKAADLQPVRTPDAAEKDDKTVGPG